MPQFLVRPEDLAGDRFRLDGPEAFHVSRVLRRKVGDAIELFDGRGGRYAGVIRSISADGVIEGDVTGKAHAPRRAYPVELRLYLSLLKSSQWEWAIEKAAELGASAIVPTVTPRTVVQLRELTPAKAERWGKILQGAAKQCGRADVPALAQPQHYRDAIVGASKDGVALVAWEKHAGASTYAGLREVLREARAKSPQGLKVNVFIGPEGGFSDEEIELAECEGAALFSLGPTTLRAETAAVAACTVVLYELGAA
ncbi:MAG: 16S rRNA (uracil(1498)-N(3))-methyltransferase [Elusimicrobia bacterium]|nr:16S rRNA (uracil(1498)-N(3))-methyltransferase [Elusimicrobiota bacterium]